MSENEYVVGGGVVLHHRAMVKKSIQSFAQELANAIGEKDGSWREIGIQRDIDSKSDNWQRWSSIVGWPHHLAMRIDAFILQERAYNAEREKMLKA